MRSRRHKLQVSTFPFLAVLLCAMGALLLVLLVMDRRAHDAARARAEQAARRAAEEQASEAEAQRTDLDRAREAALAARQQERDAEHARLVSRQTQVEGQILSVREQLAQAVERLRAEQHDMTAVRNQTEAERAKAAAEEQALVQVHGDEAKKSVESESSRKALTRMTADLARLEQTLADLKAAREKDQKTYSVVPYNGKHGDSRRPLYVECTDSDVIFYPDHLSLAESRSAADVQTEVQRRLARQKELLPPAQAAAYSPYLMLLVRPDGVVSYYRLREALRGLKIDFGYEFIDKDWVLDFPVDGQERPQAWMTAAKPPSAPLSASPTGPRMVGAPVGSGPELPPIPPGPSAGPNGQAGVFLPHPGSGLADNPGSSPQGVVFTGPGGNASGPADPDASGPPLFGPNGAGQAVTGAASQPGAGLPTAPATGNQGQASGPARSGQGAPADGKVTVGPPGTPVAGSQGQASGPARTAQGAAADARGITGTLGAPVVAGPPHADAPSPPAVAAATKTDPAAWAPGAGGAKAPTEPGPKDASKTPGAAAPGNGPGTTGAQGAGASPGNGPDTAGAQGAPASPGSATATTGAADKPGDDEFLRAPPPPLPKTSRPPAPLRPARLSGDRDWILYVECKAEGVVIYPTQLLVPASALGRPSGSNPLLQSVQQLIDRKQGTVRQGETPYRPEVRFLVHPDAGRTYHLAYPTLDALSAPKTAQYLGPEDDVATIVAH